jgi:glycosyltransferase involved in cell wall biosynthesis
LQRGKIITYHGVKNNVREYLAKCNAVIHPSYHEGMSNVLLEAAATGRPMIASNIPGCREIFDEGVSGFGFNVKDVDSLVNAINKFIRLPYEKKKAMGIAARKKVENEFNRNIVINEYLKEVNRIMEER